MIEILWTALVMYLLGIIFVLGLVEPTNEEDTMAPLRLGLIWPFLSLAFLWAMIMDSIYG